MLKEIRPAIVMLVALTLITGLVYPLAMTGIAGVIFPQQANGSLIEQDGKVVGSALIGQDFTERPLFPRPAFRDREPDPKDPTKTIDEPYNAANSSGSNLGPTNKALIERVKGDVDKLKEENPRRRVPIDLVTTSASGLDPAHLAGGRAVPGAARCQGAQSARGSRCASSSMSTSKAAFSASSASRA